MTVVSPRDLSAGVRVIAFDADDTLWHSEDLFTGAHAALEASLGIPRERLEHELGDVEHRNLPTFGFGAKSFALSAIEYLVSVAPTERLPALIGEVLDARVCDTLGDLIDVFPASAS